MTDQTIKALRKTMAAIVDVAPDAPELPVVPAAVPSALRWTPTLVATAAFAMVLILGVGTVILASLGSGDDAEARSVGSGAVEFDPLTAEWDVVAIFDAGAIDVDPLLLQGTVRQVEGLQGVSDVVVVSADGLRALLDWPVVPGPGIIVSTSGNATIAEEAAMLVADGTTNALVQMLFSPAVGEARVNRAVDVLTRDAVLSDDGLLTATQSGPEPRFDTGPLGQEMVLEPADSDSTAALSSVISMPSPPREIGMRTPVYLGHIGEVHAFVASSQDDQGAPTICVTRALGAGVFGGGCNDLRAGGWVEDGTLNGRIAYGATGSGNLSEPAAITFTALPEDVSVVAIELESGGDRYWQRPVGGSALFVVPGRLNISFTVTTFDSTGGIVVTEKRSL